MVEGTDDSGPMTLLAVPPLVVGTISPHGLVGVAARAVRDRVVDMVEARLDLALPPPAGEAQALPDLTPFFPVCAQLERTGTPVLATIRLVADGGRWTEDASRLPWFEQALGVASWVDIEIESAIAPEIVRRAHERGRRVIVSHHDFVGTPTVDALGALITRARRLNADIVKVATTVDSLEAHDRLIDLLRRERSSTDAPVALVGMGPVGTPLRTYLPSVGSRLTYGYLDSVAAPGQIHAADLVSRLIADCPVYADSRRRQGRL